jgi:flagellar protein FliS
MNARHMNAYKAIAVQTAVSEAEPLDLILMVYRRLLDNLRLAQKAMEEGKDSAEPLGRSLDLIQKGLMAALDRDRGGDIALNLAALYDWAIREVLQARLKSNPMMLSGVIQVFKDLQLAWEEIRAMRSGATSPSPIDAEGGSVGLHKQG